MKVRETAILPNQLYSDNKVKIKKLYKAHGLKFNQGALHSAQIFLWQGDGQEVEGKFAKDEDGITVHSELVVTAGWRTDLFDELKELVEELGGSWAIAEVEELQKEEDGQKLEAIKKFEEAMWNRVLTEERYARRKGREHCPVLKNIITEVLTERHEKFGLKDLTPWDMLAEAYAIVDSEVSE